MRRVNFLAGLELDFADRQHVLRALVQQLDDLRVQLVDRFAMFRNVHSFFVAADVESTDKPTIAGNRLGNASEVRSGLRATLPRMRHFLP